MRSWSTLCVAFGAAFTSGQIHAAAAQEQYPVRPIRMVIPFAPGGSNDVVGRIVAQKLTGRLGTQVIVDNRGGAAGAIAIDIVTKAAPDGYTVLLNSSGIVLTPALGARTNYDIEKDFTPVALISSVPMVLLVHPGVPANTIQEFIKHAKANPGKLTYGSAGTGNITHLGVLLLEQATGISAVHVPYKGAGPALVDAMAGNTQFVMSTIATAQGVLKDKRMKALAVTGLKRSPVIPEVPTVAETVVPKFEATTWQGVLLPANAPAAIVRRLNSEILAVLQDKDLDARFAAAGASPLGSSPEEYRAYLRNELARWSAIIRTAGIKLD